MIRSGFKKSIVTRISEGCTLIANPVIFFLCCITVQHAETLTFGIYFESRLSKKSFVGFHTARDFVARGRSLCGQKRLAPLAKRSTCSKSILNLVLFSLIKKWRVFAGFHF